VSISPTFYELLYFAKAMHAAFFYLKFGIILFWHKKIDWKSVLEMLVILTNGVNKVRFTDLDKLVKLATGSLVLGWSQFLLLPPKMKFVLKVFKIDSKENTSLRLL
jgi:hypothetical protein